MTLPPLSYSFIRDFDNCPHKAFRKYMARDLPREPESPEMAWGNRVHKALDMRLSNDAPLPPDMPYERLVTPLLDRQPIAEAPLGMTREGDRADFFGKHRDGVQPWLRGKVDVHIVHGATALILDWKTGKRREDPLELEIGALLLKASYPELEVIRGAYVWLQDREVGRLYDLSDTTKTCHAVAERQRTMEAYGDRWPKTPNPLCSYCNVNDCEFRKDRR